MAFGSSKLSPFQYAPRGRRLSRPPPGVPRPRDRATPAPHSSPQCPSERRGAAVEPGERGRRKVPSWGRHARSPAGGVSIIFGCVSPPRGNFSCPLLQGFILHGRRFSGDGTLRILGYFFSVRTYSTTRTYNTTALLIVGLVQQVAVLEGVFFGGRSIITPSGNSSTYNTTAAVGMVQQL